MKSYVSSPAEQDVSGGYGLLAAERGQLGQVTFAQGRRSDIIEPGG